MRLIARCTMHNRELEGGLFIDWDGKVDLVDMLCIDPETRHPVWECLDEPLKYNNWEVKVICSESQVCTHRTHELGDSSCWNHEGKYVAAS